MEALPTLLHRGFVPIATEIVELQEAKEVNRPEIGLQFSRVREKRHEDLGLDFCIEPCTCFRRPSLRPRRKNRKDCGRLRQGWRRMGCRYQHVLREKDVTIYAQGRRLRSVPFFLCAMATVPRSQRAICANSIRLVLVEPACPARKHRGFFS